ncbi:hypothetical protein PSYMO_36433, partial [Pseudomonas amygdali pv. mori str. 301020]
GGQVTLIDVVEEEAKNIAVLQFGGGCQGCGPAGWNVVTSWLSGT